MIFSPHKDPAPGDAPAADARNLYRYTNDRGNTVVDYQVPAEYVAKGYEVLNEDGVVVKVVPRTLTEDEQKVVNAQQSLEAQRTNKLVSQI